MTKIDFRMLALALSACATDHAVTVEEVQREAGDPLAITLARGVLDPAAPAPAGTLGDLMAHFYDHPFVRYVARGAIVGARVYEDQAGVVATACTMDVIESYKGEAARLSFDTVGGGQASQSHAARCVPGEEVIVFVGEDGGRLFAVGSDRTYVVTRTAGGAETEWGAEVAAFVRDELAGGAR
jgi:hypothetical protein